LAFQGSNQVATEIFIKLEKNAKLLIQLAFVAREWTNYMLICLDNNARNKGKKVQFVIKKAA
jgi:hypothetical protein